MTAGQRDRTFAEIVSATPLKPSTRRNAELWAACIAGAIPPGHTSTRSSRRASRSRRRVGTITASSASELQRRA